MAKAAKSLQKRRLLKLAAMLEADAKNKKGIKFDIGHVGTVDGDFPMDQKEAPLNCGTSACAMGLAAISGKFKGLGYKIEYRDIRTKWNGRKIDYDHAAIKLFGIDLNQANYLFSPWTYPYNKKTGAIGEREVIRRIKRVVAGKQISKWSDDEVYTIYL